MPRFLDFRGEGVQLDPGVPGAIDSFEVDFLRTRAGFDSFVKSELDAGNDRLIGLDPTVVDMALVKVDDPHHFDSFGQIADAYAALREAAPRGSDGLTMAQINADSMMVRVFGGEEVDFDEFTLATTGRVAETVGISEIAGFHARLGELSLVDRELDREIKNPDKIKQEIMSGMSLAKLAVGQYIWVPSEEVAFAFDNFDGSWYGGIGSDENGQFSGQINTGSRWTIGKTKLLPLHEIGAHFTQARHWQKSIEKGLLSRSAGLTSIASPETSHFETFATIIESLLPEMEDSEQHRVVSEVQQRVEDLRHAVLHRAHVEINNGKPEDEVVKEAIGFLDEFGIMDVDTIKQYITDGRDLPVDRANGLLYHPNRGLARRFSGLDDGLDRKAILENLIDDYHTPEEVSTLIEAFEEDITA